MTVNELIKELQSCKEPNSEVYIERDYSIDGITFGSGHTISIESSDFDNYIKVTNEEIEDLNKEIENLENENDNLRYNMDHI